MVRHFRSNIRPQNGTLYVKLRQVDIVTAAEQRGPYTACAEDRICTNDSLFRNYRGYRAGFCFESPRSAILMDAGSELACCNRDCRGGLCRLCLAVAGRM